MIKGNAAPNIDDEPIFAAELTPYRSLGHRGLKIFLMIAGMVILGLAPVLLVRWQGEDSQSPALRPSSPR